MSQLIICMNTDKIDRTYDSFNVSLIKKIYMNTHISTYNDNSSMRKMEKKVIIYM